MYPDSLKNLIEAFKYLPSVGEKTAERFAFSIFDFDDDQISLFKESLDDVRSKVHPCSICNVLTEDDLCSICADTKRDDSFLCVVEDVKSVFLFEKIGMFKGKYHVLNGLISPIDDINPEDINISSLIDRVEKSENPELIIALKSTIEGETTTLYIKKIFENKNVDISRLSYGIPMGTEIDYLDEITLDRALSDRKKIS